MSNFKYNKLVDITTVPTQSAQIFVNNDTGSAAFVKLIGMHNTDQIMETVMIGYAASGSAVSSRLFKETLNPGETKMIELPTPGIILNPYDSLYASADDTNKVTIYVVGGRNY